MRAKYWGTDFDIQHIWLNMYGLGVGSQEMLQLSILITRWMMVMVTWNKLKAKRGLGWESSKDCLRFASDMNGNCLELWMMDCTILNFGHSDSELQNRLSTRGDWPRCIQLKNEEKVWCRLCVSICAACGCDTWSSNMSMFNCIQT